MNIPEKLVTLGEIQRAYLLMPIDNFEMGKVFAIAELWRARGITVVSFPLGIEEHEGLGKAELGQIVTDYAAKGFAFLSCPDAMVQIAIAKFNSGGGFFRKNVPKFALFMRVRDEFFVPCGHSLSMAMAATKIGNVLHDLR